jgi:nitrate reductase gamma subunit
MALVVWVWLSVGIFLAGCAWRAWRYASAPTHLRWDLYPVAHEPASRRAYGGSTFEQPEYWTHTQERHVVGSWTTMFEEIFALRGVWRHNRRIFSGSLPFHWGLYVLIATTGVIALAAVGMCPGWLLAIGPFAGVAGGLLLCVGALRLFGLRATDRGLRHYTTPLDHANLLTFAALGALSAAAVATPDGLEPVVRAVAALVRFRAAPDAPGVVVAQIALASLVLLYLPFTRMVHFFAKYFLYHDVRWDDRLVEAGSPMERRLRRALEFGVTWTAPHVGAGRSWRDVAGDVPPRSRKSS